MKILFIGDIFGRPGREAIAKYLPDLRAQHKPDFVIANADNAAHGTGLIPSLAKELYELGLDLLTGGDHVWDQKEMIAHLDRSPWVLRPLNYPPGTPGKGWLELTTPSGKKLVIVHLQGRVFMNALVENPFLAMDDLLKKIPHKNIIVDFHAEATSEKMAMAHYLDGRVSAVLGTHTHIPTADARILPDGTATLADIGMTGDYNSVVGAEKVAPIQKFTTSIRLQRLQPAAGDGVLCCAVVTLDDMTGRAQAIEQIRCGNF
jgi:metallophosphoesterase (TIGR00282 family)